MYRKYILKWLKNLRGETQASTPVWPHLKYNYLKEL